MKRPRYEVDSGFCQMRPILADKSTAMYISILWHEHGMNGKEFLSRCNFVGYALVHSPERPSRHLADPTTWMVMSALLRVPIWSLCSELGLQLQPEIHFVSSVGRSENFVPWDRKFFVDSGQLNDRIFRATLYRHPSRLTLPDYVYSRYVEGLGF